MFETFTGKTFLGDEFEFFVNDERGRKFRQNAVHEKVELDALASVFKHVNPLVCLDVGANIGHHSAFFTRFFESVHCFEPNPRVFEVLERNLQRNGLNARAHNFGLSDLDFVQEFYIDKDNLGESSFVPSSKDSNQIEVTRARLKVGDEFIEEHGLTGVDFIKIDVEGYEARVLCGLQRTIKEEQPVISIEWNNRLTKKEFKEREVFATILKGYTPVAFGSRWGKELYPGVLDKVRRRMLKTFGGKGKYKCWKLFFEELDYSLVLLLPDRFKEIFSSSLSGQRY